MLPGNLPPTDTRPVPLATAARLAGLSEPEFAELVSGLRGLPEGYRLTEHMGARGETLYDPEECEGLGWILGLKNRSGA